MLAKVQQVHERSIEWSGHTPEEVHANQEEAQTVILRLVAEIGEGAFSPNLLQKLKSGAASTDDSGDIFLQAKGELAGVR